MKKSIMLVALATFMLVFAGCEKNEDENTYQETYNLHFNGTEDGDDLNAVVEGYLKAAGIAANAEEESVLVNGKDSADCVAQFLKLMANAEKQLAAQTQWDEVVSVAAHDTKFTCVYQKQWGAKDDNLKNPYPDGNPDDFYANPLKDINGKCSEVQRGKYIKDYYVDTFKSRKGYKALGKNVWLSMDLNYWAGGRYAYISAEPTDDIEEAITGAFVLRSEKGNMPTTITYKGVEYTCCSELDGAPLPNYRNRDLNENAGGKRLYLYTTHDKSLKRALLWGFYACYYDSFDFGWGTKKTELSSYIKHKKIEIVGDVAEFIPGTNLVKKTDDLNNLTLENRDSDRNLNVGVDLNENAGGVYLYVVQQWENRK